MFKLRNFLIIEAGPQGIPSREMRSVVNKGCSVECCLTFWTREYLGVGPGLCTVVCVVLVSILQMPGTPRVVITKVPSAITTCSEARTAAPSDRPDPSPKHSLSP